MVLWSRHSLWISYFEFHQNEPYSKRLFWRAESWISAFLFVLLYLPGLLYEATGVITHKTCLNSVRWPCSRRFIPLPACHFRFQKLLFCFLPHIFHSAYLGWHVYRRHIMADVWKVELQHSLQFRHLQANASILPKSCCVHRLLNFIFSIY